MIRVVFHDQAVYARTLFRGAKNMQNWKKDVFLVILTNFGKDMMDKWRKHAKNAYLGSSFIPDKCMFRVCFESHEDDIQPEIQVVPPPPLDLHRSTSIDQGSCPETNQ